MNISLAILSEIFIQIYYFFLRVMQGIKSGCFFWTQCRWRLKKFAVAGFSTNRV